MTVEQQPAAGAPRLSESQTTGLRLATVRRLYFYLVALIAMVATLGAIDGLLASIADAWVALPGDTIVAGPGYVRRTIASNAGLLVVAAPIFLIHWAAVQGRLADAGERAAAMRKFFLYAASAVALGYLLVRSFHLLSGIARLAYSQPLDRSDLFPYAWAHYAASALVAGLLLWYWQSVARSDGDFGLEQGTAVVWRRLFLGAAILAGLAMVVVGSATLLTAFVDAALSLRAVLVSESWFANRAGDGTALLLLGLLVAHIPWQSWRAVGARRPEAMGPEGESAILRLFLYVAVVGGAVATLLPAALVMRSILLWAFDAFAEPFTNLLRRLATPLGYIPAGLVVWWIHAGRVRALEAQGDEDERGAAATVRRIYFYAVSATGLVLLWVGVIYLLQVMLEQLLLADQVKQGVIWKQPLALGLSLVAVGLPVWLLHWRAAQQVARADTEAGAAERGSLPRKVYLYGVAFVGAILIVVSLAQVIYRVFLSALGDSTSTLFSPELAEELARSVIAGLLWAVHLVALRGDGRRGDDMPVARLGERARERQRARLLKRLDTLQREVAETQAQLAELDDL